MVCGGVVLAKRGMRIKTGGSVVCSGGLMLMLMETIESPRVGGVRANLNCGRGILGWISGSRVVREDRRCC
jgi:hypothetical protein